MHLYIYTHTYAHGQNHVHIHIKDQYVRCYCPLGDMHIGVMVGTIVVMIVIQNRADYVAEATRLLSNTNTYIKLKTDPLPRFTLEAISFVGDALIFNIITQQEASFLVKAIHYTPYIYHLPKVHKNLINPPG